MIKMFLKRFKKPKSTEVVFKSYVYPAPEPYDPFTERKHVSSLDSSSSKPELSKDCLEKSDNEEKTSSLSEDNSTQDGEIPLSPELVKGINAIIEENYEYVWRWDASRQIADLYEDFRYFHNRYCHHSLKSLTKERITLLDDVYYAMQALKDKHISYKEYKSLKNLLNELYKSSALRYYTQGIDEDSIRPFTGQDRVETLEEMLMKKWGKPLAKR